MKFITSNLLEKLDISHGFCTNDILENGLIPNFYDKYQDIAKQSYQALEKTVNMPLFGMNQTHSCDIKIIDDLSEFSLYQADYNTNNLPKCDGIITKHKNIILTTRTADCLPVLITNASMDFVAIVHSGWIGSLGGINQEMIGTLEEMGFLAKDMIISIGPSIDAKNYEVQSDFKQNFLAKDPSAIAFFNTNESEKMTFDNKKYVHAIYEKLQVGAIESIEINTYSSNQFYSHRAFTQNKKPDGNSLTKLVGRARFELATNGLKVRCSTDWATVPFSCQYTMSDQHCD